MPERHTLSTANVQLSYLRWNHPQEPLLLLHGMADHGLVWSALGEYLGSDYDIIAPDMRGHGDSSKPENDYSFESAIADLENLMDSVGWSSAHIVAHSWSGKLATIWATQNPQRIKSLVLVDPIFIWKIPSIFKLTFPLLYRVLPFLQGMGPFSSYEAAEAKAKTSNQYQDWTDLQQKVFAGGIEQKSDGSYGSKFTIAARDRIFEEVMRVPGLTTPIYIPTLFIQPEKGVNRLEWQLKPYKTYLKHLEISQVPGNHWAFLTKPEIFNQTVKNFLQQNHS
ncbi:alpha/beta fold hydrolase [Calothrix sp. PCC 6303]|uniref:alpha/beta fold hydrolase n=1 Tax=Calothrix sp. PCC 6303 TaxID=1170562 RepID=UPI0002A00FF1|nr:alpha/beta hydrolase [Calothrix sp. PCC 6303]AFZ00835.1 alpha/beta hydrolase fold protein [Calothrix sp. PCC 6303]